MHAKTDVMPRVLLQRAQFLTLQRPRGLCVQVRRGTLWVTVDGQPEDIELGPGQHHCFSSAAPAVLGTLGGAAEFSAGVACTRPPYSAVHAFIGFARRLLALLPGRAGRAPA